MSENILKPDLNSDSLSSKQNNHNNNNNHHKHHTWTSKLIPNRKNSIKSTTINSSKQVNNAKHDCTKPRLIEKSITINCNCCGTMLNYPVSISRIKCLTCHTYFTLNNNDNNNTIDSLDSIQNPNIPLASYKSLKHSIELDESYIKSLNFSIDNNNSIDKLYKNVDLLIENSFKNLNTLNNCFILNNQNSVTYNSPNLNFIEIKKFFKLLIDLPTKRPIFKLLSHSLYLLKHPPINLNFKNINWLLILFEIPLLNESLLIGKNSLSVHFNNICYDIIKRIIGLLNSIDKISINYLVHWWSRLPPNEFVNKINLINLYITFHINRFYTHLIYDKFKGSDQNLVLNLRETEDDINFKNNSKLRFLNSILNDNESNNLLSSLGLLNSNNNNNNNNNNNKLKDLKISNNFYSDCWHLKTACKIMSFLFVSNSLKHSTKLNDSIFYNTLIDYINVKQDYDIWQFNNSFTEHENSVDLNPEILTNDLILMENNKSYLGITILNGVYKRSNFTICNYPFLISLGSKIAILEHDAKRVMGLKAEQAFISSLIDSNKNDDNIYFKLSIRRDHLIIDSLKQIQNHPNDLKKFLKVEFINELGIDAGGLKKEWFTLLTNELFSPKHGLITYNNENNIAYFSILNNKNYNNELYYFLGVIIGMAIYNSIILNIKFPKFLFNKLLGYKTTLNDLNELEPSLTKNLKQLLKMKNVENLNLNFQISIVDNNKILKNYDLIPNGSNILVNDSNKIDYINKYYKFLLDEIVEIPFNQFSNGFRSIMNSKILSLFTPSEIQKLIIGDDNLNEKNKFDIETLKSITKFSNCSNNDLIIKWFWDYFRDLSLINQRKLLRFITGSDRIPATGLISLQFKISKLIDENSKFSERLPIAHTCFNELCLWEYKSREILKNKLDIAINESEGFALR